MRFHQGDEDETPKTQMNADDMDDTPCRSAFLI